MKKFVRVVNIIATAISAISILAVVSLLLIFSSSKNVEAEESIIVVDQTELTRRKTNNTLSFYAKNVNQNAKYYIVIAFELYDIEKQSLFLTVDDENQVYLVAVNDNQEASIVYS